MTTASEVFVAMLKIKAIPSIDRRQYDWYSEVSQAMRQAVLGSKVLKAYSGTERLVHMHNKEYLRHDKEGILLGLRGVAAYLRAPGKKRKF